MVEEEQDPKREQLYRAYRDADDADLTMLAIQKGKEFLERYPDSAGVSGSLARLHIEVSRLEEAEHLLTRAMELVGDGPVHFIHFMWGHLESDRKDASAAEACYKRGIELVPDDATGYIYLGALYARTGRLKEAEEQHRRGTACVEGELSEAWFNLALVLRAQERFEEALDAFNQALSIDPNYAEAKVGKADIEAVLDYLWEE